MAHIAKLRMLLFSAFGPAIAVLLLLFFAGYVVLGSNGVLAWGDYKRQLHNARGELKQVQAHRQELKNRVDLNTPDQPHSANRRSQAKRSQADN